MAEKSEKLAPASQMEGARSDKDYAIEHGRYLADAAEAFQAALNEKERISEADEQSGNPNLSDELSNAIDVVSDCWRSLESCIYEFRKRALRAESRTQSESREYSSLRAILDELASCDFNERNCASLELASLRIQKLGREALQYLREAQSETVPGSDYARIAAEEIHKLRCGSNTHDHPQNGCQNEIAYDAEIIRRAARASNSSVEQDLLKLVAEYEDSYRARPGREWVVGRYTETLEDYNFKHALRTKFHGLCYSIREKSQPKPTSGEGK